MDGATVPRTPSASVGNYLKAIWESSEDGAASTKDVADRLAFSKASVTNMFARLREMGLVEYEPYRGASLTEEGRSEALRLVRRHRLIETFLLDQLGYSWEDVHEEAEQLEHAVSDRFTERLAALLAYLGERGLVPGRLLTVEEVRSLDGVVTFKDEEGIIHSLGAPLAGALFVRGAAQGDAE